MQIENLVLVGTKGEEVPESMPSDERRRLYPPLGVVKIIKLRWKCDGDEFALDLTQGGNKYNWEVLPDRSGFLVTCQQSNGSSSAAILNGDATTRFSLRNPWPDSPFFGPNDKYGFDWPLVHNGQPGFVVGVTSVGATGILTTVDHFYAIDPNTGVFSGSHPLH